MRAIADRVVLQATSLGASVVRVRPPRLRWASGRVPIASVSQRSNRRKAASLIASMGTLSTQTSFACDAQAARAQWRFCGGLLTNVRGGRVFGVVFGLWGARRVCA